MNKHLSLVVTILTLTLVLYGLPAAADEPDRARDLGIPFAGTPGPLNSITDLSLIHI